MIHGRWLKFEFLIYYLLLGWSIYKGFSCAMRISTPEGNPDFDRLRGRLSHGWIYNSSLMDNSDEQYSEFRKNIFILTFLIILFILIRRLIYQWLFLNVLLSLFFILLIHRINTIFFIICLIINYWISRLNNLFPSSWIMPAATWIWAIYTLLVTEGLSFVYMDFGFNTENWSPWIVGGYHQWWQIYRLSILRMISFNIDYYYAMKYSSNRHFHSQYKVNKY
jgi:hypothetical protein